jgi:hypothetical protein
MWDREKQASFVRPEKSRARASCRRDVRETRYWCRWARTQHVDETVSPNNIQTSPLRIEEHVIGIADDV